MAKVSVLVEGTAEQINGGWIASSTVVLVESAGKKIIVDPGCDRKTLLSVLEKQKLALDSINFVLLTHSHTDHALLAGIFEKAKVITPVEIYEDSTQKEYKSDFLGEGLKIIPTPGHCLEHCSLIVPTEKGTFAIAGDLFWWTKNETQKLDTEKIDDAHPSETNMKTLIESRKKIMQIADYIIPGHGKMFKVEK